MGREEEEKDGGRGGGAKICPGKKKKRKVPATEDSTLPKKEKKPSSKEHSSKALQVSATDLPSFCTSSSVDIIETDDSSSLTLSAVSPPSCVRPPNHPYRSFLLGLTLPTR